MPKVSINFSPHELWNLLVFSLFSSTKQMPSYGSALLIPGLGVTLFSCDLSSVSSFTLELLCAE